MSVNKDHFLNILGKYSSTTPEEAQSVISLKNEYPFSQVLHALSARVTKDHDFPQHTNELQLAAVHAADRAVLKDILTSVRPAQKETEDVGAGKASDPMVTDGDKTGDGLAARVINDLEQLHQSRQNFEKLFSPEQTNVQEQPEKSGAESQEESSKSKKERIIEIAKTLNAQSGTEAPQSRSSRRKRRDEIMNAFLDAIATSKTELSPENDKQKEQLEFIEQFIKMQPSISSLKDRLVNPTSNLETVRSGEFNDNIVSETLVEILLKQGKKDKAIEVLKKLIWKFPQKKAYFASQIEDLRK